MLDADSECMYVCMQTRDGWASAGEAECLEEGRRKRAAEKGGANGAAYRAQNSSDIHVQLGKCGSTSTTVKTVPSNMTSWTPPVGLMKVIGG